MMEDFLGNIYCWVRNQYSGRTFDEYLWGSQLRNTRF